MRISWTLSLALLAANLLPAQINPKIWNLITLDDKLVYGLDLDRYRHSVVSTATGDSGPLFAATARYIVNIEGDPKKNRHLTILLNFTPPLPPPPPTDDDDTPAPAPTPVFMLDATTAIVADDDTVRDSLVRWRSEAPLADLAADARKLAESDDAWVVVVKPLAFANSPQSQEPLPKHLADFIEVVEQLTGGIRFGPYYQAHVDARAKTADDAYSLAALGRWLPGLLQTVATQEMPRRILSLLENFTVQAIGRTATLSFSIAEDKLAEVLKNSRPVIEE